MTTEGATRAEVLSVVAWVNVEEFKRGTRISVVALTKVETESRVATEALTVEVDDTTDTKGAYPAEQTSEGVETSPVATSAVEDKRIQVKEEETTEL